MKKVIFFLLVIIVATAHAQDNLITNPKASIKLAFEQGSGTNASAVVYNPDKKVYYSVIAGNTSFPLETFSETGDNLYYTNANVDARGMWWNEKEDQLEINCYNDGGLMKIGLNDHGHAGTFSALIREESNQPIDNSCGTYDSKKKEILYYDKGIVFGYKRSNGKEKTRLALALPVGFDDINRFTVIYTGKKSMELGVLDYENNKVYLFDRKKGEHTGTVNLPDDAVVTARFRFSYANDHIWLYDVDTRSWSGYKIFY